MKSRIRNLIQETFPGMGIREDVDFKVERSKRPEYGHFSSNVALVLAKKLRDSPLNIANSIKDNLQLEQTFIEKVEAAPPGFLNFFISGDHLRQYIHEIIALKERFGTNRTLENKTAQVEFVSANPTGPLTVGHGRQAVLGDTIARILESCGCKVTREYYFNNAGRQMRMLALSTYSRYRQLLNLPYRFPDGGYEGDYIFEIARNLVETFGDALKDDPENPVFRQYSEEWVFRLIRETLTKLGIKFDIYFNEKSLYENGSIERVLQELHGKDATYKKDGAIWFKAADFGGTGDKVLWKSVVDEATYRLPDIAYHKNKLDRKFDLIIDVFGSDHQATYPDVLAGLRALGYDVSPIKVVIHQFVTLSRGGEKVKMSTRKATYVTLDELIDEVGADVVRFFFLIRTANSHLNFDIELAKKESEENPVFYVQYAYARICSILAHADSLNFERSPADLSLLDGPETMALINSLTEFPEVVELAAETLEPHHLVNYLQSLASAFHRFYTECRVISDNADLTAVRLLLIKSVQIVLRNGLSLLGISTPEKM